MTPSISYEGDNVVVVHEGESMILIDGVPEMEFQEIPGHNPGCLTMILSGIIFTGDAYIPDLGVKDFEQGFAALANGYGYFVES